MPELTNTEFAAHLRIAAKMMDCEDNHGNPIVPGIVRSMRKAADIIDTDEATIAALQSENAEKDKEIERLQAKAIQWRKTSEENFASCEKLQAVLSRVEAERDAAVADIEQMAVSLPVCMACQFCAHGTEGMECDECDDCYNFVWRGAQGEG